MTDNIDSALAVAGNIHISPTSSALTYSKGSSAIVLPGHERMILSVNRNNYRQVIGQALATRQLLNDRDVGEIVGTPVEDYTRGKPQTIRLCIFLYNYSSPPYTKQKGMKFVKANCNIPDVNPAKLNWLLIKQACGGSTGYMWGRFLTTINLSNGRKIACYGATAEVSYNQAKAYAAFSTASVVTVSTTEEKQEGVRATDQLAYKRPTRIYPAYFTVLNYQKIQVESNAEFAGLTQTLSGSYRRTKVPRIPLWVQKAPTNTQLLINQALQIQGVKH